MALLSEDFVSRVREQMAAAPVLNSWWLKALTWVYLVGYWLYLAYAAVVEWPGTSFLAWTTDVLFYQATYALVWPALLVLKLAALH